jgi:uncharacterized membrane protein (DUF485 family)
MFMGHFGDTPRIDDAGDTPVLAARRSRYGLALFSVYLALYLGFILLNVLDPAVMETTPVAGINLAIVYGFVLIAAALTLALVYAFLCRDHPSAEGDRPSAD